ncbi:MAG: ATP-dependent Clp protease ATP-binding subunit [Gemmataceae bacterium]|nr:ATP-dependent Clp protease ATP-binding subunit [Gemmataceae bacterium]
MQFRIPVYVYQHKEGYTARPLFFARPTRTDDNLNRLLTKLAREVVQTIEQLGRNARHDDAAAWTFCPPVATHRVPLEIELRRRVAKVKYLVITFSHLGRRLAFTPSVPDVWFEVGRNEQLGARARAALTEHWRQVERDAAADEEVRPETGGLAGKAWVQALELSANIPAVVPKPPDLRFLMLGGDHPPDGAAELRRVGRCLDWLYPDELDRAVLRDREVDELDRLLAHPDRRPVLLCGPRLAGKTTVVHECVYRRVAARKSVHVQKENVWLVSPQRLISGMSYVGQWEGRLLAILKHARTRDHVLYFDDLIGLFLAGVTSQSSLSAAVVLKPYLERRDVRVLGEVTPEGLRVLQERDRGFADLFHPIPVREPTDADTFRTLIDRQRRLEGKQVCTFGLDVLPAVVDLQRRYERTAAFPGKAAAVLTRLAVRATETPADEKGGAAPSAPARREDGKAGLLARRPVVSRDDVLADFAARSGLSLAFLDPKQRLDRDAVRDKLREQVVGQAEAVEALADVVSVAKARLNDPDRPLAAFLFLGPTGVGKTECAKAAARTLFGAADRLLRVDLNEYTQPGAAARLAGTFAQPEGLLTAAVRRQPFAVILLDEVEKAHPEVFDLLLQVLGEGRLTDALGRTADFTNALVVMTSNLGVREAEGNLGFAAEADRAAAYTRAAERFFRPEFFNRLDRVIPFRKLSRDELGRIARRLVEDVLGREGFSQRKCVLNVSADALDRVIAAGYDPALGARAMKRAVERELSRPAADRLAALDPEDLTVVTVRAGGGGLAVDVQAPGWAAKVSLTGGEDVPLAIRVSDRRATLDRVDEQIVALRPTQPVVAGRVTPEQERYFALREVADGIAAALDEIEGRLEERRHAYLEARQPEAVGRRVRYRAVKPATNSNRDHGNGEQPFRSIVSAMSMEEAIRELLDTSEPLPGNQDLFDLENRLALLNLMATAPADEKPVFLWVRGFPGGSPCVGSSHLRDYYLKAWAEGLGIELNRAPKENAFLIGVHGIHARLLALTEVGTHLFVPKHGGPVPVRVDVVDSLPATLADPFAFGPIVRVYPEGQAICDVRTGLICPPPFNPEVFRAFTLAVLPRPQ